MTTQHEQIQAAEAAWIAAGERLAELIRETTHDLDRREKALQVAEASAAEAAETAVALQLETTGELIAQTAREEMAKGIAVLIDARLSSLNPASGTASTLRQLQAEVLEWRP